MSPRVNGKFCHFVNLLVLVSGAFVGVSIEFGVFFFHFDPSPSWPERTGVFRFSSLSRLSHVPWLWDCSKGMRKGKKKKIKSKLSSWSQGGKFLNTKNEKGLKKNPSSSQCKPPRAAFVLLRAGREKQSQFFNMQKFGKFTPK